MKKEIQIGKILKTGFAVGMIGLGVSALAVGTTLENCNIDPNVPLNEHEWIHCESSVLPVMLDYSNFPDEPKYVGVSIRFPNGKGIAFDTQDGVQVGVEIADPEKEYGDY